MCVVRCSLALVEHEQASTASAHDAQARMYNGMSLALRLFEADCGSVEFGKTCLASCAAGYSGTSVVWTCGTEAGGTTLALLGTTPTCTPKERTDATQPSSHPQTPRV
jgi:hypothetical protein